MASKTIICVLFFLCLIFNFSTKTISAPNKVALDAASQLNADKLRVKPYIDLFIAYTYTKKKYVKFLMLESKDDT
ncbi:hypothetical protein DEO72_LG3g3546 [Vigna unguiculata]|uniref:Transmembrane protein n=1 Tax=Vigna unguiculata TaxID=3917 RepID=A0A4D6LJV3_VIGUN|nr:hypothetical protein DEO72_LG3g3546 [Vigna unguiculata]